MENNHQSYIPVLEDISDDDDDDQEVVTTDIVFCFPNGECSRTSPGNHSTVRRWRQRNARKHENCDENNLSGRQSAAALSPISVKTPSVLDCGPSSAPSILQWGTECGLSSPTLSSTPTASNRPRIAFDISSIVDKSKSHLKNRPKTVFEETSKTVSSSGQSIPVGIAVGRQRVTQPATGNINISTNPAQTGRETSSVQPTRSTPSTSIQLAGPSLATHPPPPSLPPPLHNQFLPPTIFPSQPIPTPSLPQPLPIPSLTPTLPQTLPTLTLPPLVPLPPPASHTAYPHIPPLPPSTLAQWTHGQGQAQAHPAGYGYQTNFHPDPSYYLYLQHQLLLLHHHHLQMSRQIPPPVDYLQDVQRHHNYNSSGLREDHNLVQDIQPNINNSNAFDHNNRHKEQQQQATTVNTEHEGTNDDTVIKSFNMSINTDDSGLEVSTESNNNDSHHGICNDQLHEDSILSEDNISVGDEKDTEHISNVDIAADETLIDVDENKNEVNDHKYIEVTENAENDPITKGLYLLAEGIECMEKSKAEPKRERKVRYASTDCCDYDVDALQILCDVANLQPKSNIRGKDLCVRSERSKSLDSHHLKIDRHHTSTAVKNDIREFISNKAMKYQKLNKKMHEKKANETKTKSQAKKKTTENMDAWEIDLRIQMAEKQKKYNAINRKLMKMQKVKNKSPEKGTKKSKHNKSLFKKQILIEDDEADVDTSKDQKEISYNSARIETRDENVNILSSFSETFNKFKKSYLASNKVSESNPKPDQLKQIGNFENWSKQVKGCVQTSVKLEAPIQNDTVRELAKAKVKEEPSFNNIKKDGICPYKKPRHEKFLLVENYQYKKESIEDDKYNIVDEDFSQYKHKKIRRKSKDSFKVLDFPENEIIEKELTTKDKTDKREEKASNPDFSNHKRKKLKNKTSKKSKFIEQKSKIDILHNENENTQAKPFQNIQEDKKKDLPVSEMLISAKRSEKKKKKKKDKKKKKERKERQRMNDNFETSNIQEFNDISCHQVDHVRSCILKDTDLVDGLRIIKRTGTHFYPGRLTEISAPDIYGIVVDNERGNKPHIFSQEEVLNEAVLEMKPKAVNELEVGARVCAFWSNHMNYLHPGTVAGPDIDEQFVIIQLDDGDSRDIHIDQVRYLPENYPLIDPGRQHHVTDMSSILRRQSGKKMTSKTQNKNEVDCKVKKSNAKLQVDQKKNSSKRKIKSKRPGAENKTIIPMASSVPKHLLWSWSDEGQKLSAKARKVYHDSIEKDDDTIHVGDCAVFLSTGRPDRPYIGRIHSMWQTSAGNMKVQVNWFYHPAEVEGTAVGGGRVEDIKTKGALFESCHFDENDIHTISHKCHILEVDQFKQRLQIGGDQTATELYYLAGEYDPVEGVIVFRQGVGR
eukprot:GFUD01003957.1.p1 GENE.GFUD01003957.1~~GFUD01003957.1.p1  ORF type:complete len:1381 (+),score=371.85 GFUD01003957.1:1199-5341(+)